VRSAGRISWIATASSSPSFSKWAPRRLDPQQLWRLDQEAHALPGARVVELACCRLSHRRSDR
jgi:hypothetical protein